jgi:uncharacterized membrane protein
MKSSIKSGIFGLALGLVLIASGLLIVGESLKTISGLCLGIGAGLFGVNIGKLVMYQYYKKNPKLEKQQKIELRDERTVAIRNRAKAKAYDIAAIVLMIIPLLLIIMGSPLYLVLSVIAFYLFVFGMQIFFTVKYDKEM